MADQYENPATQGMGGDTKKKLKGGPMGPGMVDSPSQGKQQHGQESKKGKSASGGDSQYDDGGIHGDRSFSGHGKKGKGYTG